MSRRPWLTRIDRTSLVISLITMLVVLVLLLSGCQLSSKAVTAAETAALESPYGQLFCQISTATGPAVVGVIDTKLTTSGGPLAVMALNAAAAAVQANCSAAAAAVGGTAGIPVSPPASSVGNVAIQPVSASAAPATATPPA